MHELSREFTCIKHLRVFHLSITARKFDKIAYPRLRVCKMKKKNHIVVSQEKKGENLLGYHLFTCTLEEEEDEEV